VCSHFKDVGLRRGGKGRLMRKGNKVKEKKGKKK
jgi:hypothetical protein